MASRTISGVSRHGYKSLQIPSFRPALGRRAKPLELLLREEEWRAVPELHGLRALREQALWESGRAHAPALQLLRCLHGHRLVAREVLPAGQAGARLRRAGGGAAACRGGRTFGGRGELRCGSEDLARVSTELIGEEG